MRRPALWLPILVACSDGEAPDEPETQPTDETTVTVTDSGEPAPTSEPSDTGEITVPPSPCADAVVTWDAFELEPGGVGRQFDVATALDGAGLWLAWTVEGAGGRFEVMGGRLQCDGTWDIAPRVLGAGDGQEHYSPSVAVGSAGALFAWEGDAFRDGGFHIDVYTALVGRDGSTVREPGYLALTAGGAPAPGDAGMPHVAALPAGGYALVGSRELVGSKDQVFLQEIDALGEPVGDAALVDPAPLVQQNRPIAAPWQDEIAVTWETAADGGRVVLATVGDVGTDVVAFGGQRPEVGAGVGGVWTTWNLVGAPSIRLADPDRDIVTLGSAGAVELGPSVAVGHEHVGVVWYRMFGALNHAVELAFVDLQGNVVREDELVAGNASDDELTLTYVGGEAWFLAWSEGEGSASSFRLHGRFFRP